MSVENKVRNEDQPVYSACNVPLISFGQWARLCADFGQDALECIQQESLSVLHYFPPYRWAHVSIPDKFLPHCSIATPAAVLSSAKINLNARAHILTPYGLQGHSPIEDLNPRLSIDLHDFDSLLRVFARELWVITQNKKAVFLAGKPTVSYNGSHRNVDTITVVGDSAEDLINRFECLSQYPIEHLVYADLRFEVCNKEGSRHRGLQAVKSIGIFHPPKSGTWTNPGK